MTFPFHIQSFHTEQRGGIKFGLGKRGYRYRPQTDTYRDGCGWTQTQTGTERQRASCDPHHPCWIWFLTESWISPASFTVPFRRILEMLESKVTDQTRTSLCCSAVWRRKCRLSAWKYKVLSYFSRRTYRTADATVATSQTCTGSTAGWETYWTGRILSPSCRTTLKRCYRCVQRGGLVFWVNLYYKICSDFNTLMLLWMLYIQSVTRSTREIKLPGVERVAFSFSPVNHSEASQSGAVGWWRRAGFGVGIKRN